MMPLLPCPGEWGMAKMLAKDLARAKVKAPPGMVIDAERPAAPGMSPRSSTAQKSTGGGLGAAYFAAVICFGGSGPATVWAPTGRAQNAAATHRA